METESTPELRLLTETTQEPLAAIVAGSLTKVSDSLPQQIQLPQILVAHMQQGLNGKQACPADAAFEISHLFKLRFGRLIGANTRGRSDNVFIGSSLSVAASPTQTSATGSQARTTDTNGNAEGLRIDSTARSTSSDGQ